MMGSRDFVVEAVRLPTVPRHRFELIRAGYLRCFTLAVLVWVGLFGVATLIVDPYGVSPIRLSIPHLTRYKPKRLDIDRLIKPYEVWRYQPQTVFLGTSRIHQAIDPAVLDGSRLAPAYNASVPASSLGMNISYLNQYIKLDSRLRYVFIELFLYNFLGQDQQHPPNSPTEMLQNTATLLFSYEAAWDALSTLLFNIKSNTPCYEIKPGGYFYYPPGHDAKGTFEGFPAGMWTIHRSAHGKPTLSEPAFAAVDELIETAQQNHIELTFLMMPYHPYFWYYIEAIDRWDLIADWLTRLTAKTSILSFAQPNAWVYEPVQHHMTYWNDPFHFSLEMGRGIEMSLVGRSEADTPANFMMRLTPDRVAPFLASQREAVRRWAQGNRDFVAAFAAEKKRSEATGM